VSYELNGIGRETFILDKTVAPKTKSRPKADLADPTQVAAPIPGLIAQLRLRRPQGREGRQAPDDGSDEDADTVYAPCDGVVAELHVALGDTVESKDLLSHPFPSGEILNGTQDR
jgi:pyruvate carboxylase